MAIRLQNRHFSADSFCAETTSAIVIEIGRVGKAKIYPEKNVVTGIQVSEARVSRLVNKTYKGLKVKILIAEDDRKTASYLSKGLTENGYSVDVCYDGAEAYELAKSHNYDLFIFDVMMPLRSGFDLLKSLRAEGVTTLAIFLTAKDQVEDRVSGLDLGADFYLVKPFSFSELIAVIRSLFRRRQVPESQTHATDVIEVADLRIHLLKHQVKRSGRLLDLTPLEFKLLTFLARREGEVLSRTVILEHIWDINFDCQTNVVDVHIRRLRAKVDDPFPTPLIHTIRGVGYVLRNEVSGARPS